MTSLRNISEYLHNNAEHLAIEIVDGVINNMQLEIPTEEKQQAINMYIKFMGFLGEFIKTGAEGVPQNLIEWSKMNAERQVSYAEKISNIIVRYPPTRDILTDIITRLSIEYELSILENVNLIKQINRMLDVSVSETVLAFEHLTDEYQKETQQELAKVSAPIVPVKDGVVILPLVGNIDSYRATYIMENVLPKIADLEINDVIVDFSGVLAIDRENAYYLHQIGTMLRLMGLNIIATGIRPDLAKVAVNVGINLSETKTFSNVKFALESID